MIYQHFWTYKSIFPSPYKKIRIQSKLVTYIIILPNVFRVEDVIWSSIEVVVFVDLKIIKNFEKLS